MAMLAVAGRKERRMPTRVALSALGWAVGGMMGYDQLAACGRGTEFADICYGLVMLGVAGGLYRFTGPACWVLGFSALAAPTNAFHQSI